ncbi:MAG: lysozyme inhibitor LprI family protein [Rhizomicrobium sp.]|jgi:uncharacterized protein YecT (DUF1311 family)
MTGSRLKRAAFAAVLVVATPGMANALTVKHAVYTEKSSHVDISLEYPVTGVKAIDDDIKAIVAKKAKQFKSLALGDYVEGQGAYTDEADYKIARNDGEVFSVVWNEEADFHGAHPANEIFTANYLLPDGWRVYLPEILDGERGIKRVSALSIASLDKQLAGPDAMSDRDWIAKGAAPDAPNFEVFEILKDKLRVEFVDYQVAAYAAGPQAVEIPFSQIASVMRADWRAPQASFPCAHAQSALEKTICSDAHLARLDRQVSEAYFQRVGWAKDGSIGKKPAAMQDEQRAWLKTRDASCSSNIGSVGVSCLMALYHSRLDTLERMTD